MCFPSGLKFALYTSPYARTRREAPLARPHATPAPSCHRKPRRCASHPGCNSRSTRARVPGQDERLPLPVRPPHPHRLVVEAETMCFPSGL